MNTSKIRNMAVALLVLGAGPALAQSDAMPEDKPLPHAVPLPPPDSLKPTAGEEPMAQDRAVRMGGVEAVCTGTGSAKDNPDWAAWPVRVTFSNGAAQFLSGMNVKLSEGGKTVAEFICNGPWVLFRAAAGGSYKVTASLAGRAGSPVKSASFTVPASGQQKVNIAFPEIAANE